MNLYTLTLLIPLVGCLCDTEGKAKVTLHTDEKLKKPVVPLQNQPIPPPLNNPEK